ncbi:hypothetical protein RYX36_036019 [Vicia faba]
MGGGHGHGGTTYKGVTIHQPKRWHTVTGKGLCAVMWAGGIPGMVMMTTEPAINFLRTRKVSQMEPVTFQNLAPVNGNWVDNRQRAIFAVVHFLYFKEVPKQMEI